MLAINFANKYFIGRVVYNGRSASANTLSCFLISVPITSNIDTIYPTLIILGKPSILPEIR